MVVRVVHITQTERGVKLGSGIEGFEDAMSRYALEAMRAGILGVHASRPMERGSVVDAPVPRVSRNGNARVVRDARGQSRVLTTRSVDRGEEITVTGDEYSSDEETYTRARRDVRRGIEKSREAERSSDDQTRWYKSMLGERYIHRALRLLQKKPERV
jgi:hypothetical protein